MKIESETRNFRFHLTLQADKLGVVGKGICTNGFCGLAADFVTETSPLQFLRARVALDEKEDPFTKMHVDPKTEAQFDFCDSLMVLGKGAERTMMDGLFMTMVTQAHEKIVKTKLSAKQKKEYEKIIGEYLDQQVFKPLPEPEKTTKKEEKAAAEKDLGKKKEEKAAAEKDLGKKKEEKTATEKDLGKNTEKKPVAEEKKSDGEVAEKKKPKDASRVDEKSGKIKKV